MKPDQQIIRELAYRLWEERGRWDGGADADWFAAERQLSEQVSAPCRLDGRCDQTIS